MADNKEQQKMFTLLEEAEKRGLLSPELNNKVREARSSGLFESKRDAEVVALEDKILNEDLSSYTDSEKRGLANAYVRLKHGEENDLDGRKRFGKKLDGDNYVKELRAELDPERYKSEIPNKLEEYKRLNGEGKLKWADANVKGENRSVDMTQQSFGNVELDPIISPEIQGTARSVYRQIAGGVAMGGPYMDVAPPKKLEELNEVQKAKLIKAGHDEAFRQSYVPMRQWLESKLARNKAAVDIAHEMIDKGDQTFMRRTFEGAKESFTADSPFSIVLSPEEQDIAAAYVRHVRAFDASEGVMGTLKQAGREALHATWWLGEGTVKALGSIGELRYLFYWSLVDPVAVKDYEQALKAEKRSMQREGFAYEFKAPERNILGEGVVGAAKSVPFMLSVAYGGGIGATVAGLSTGQSTFEQFSAREDVSREQALAMGVISGLAAVYVERIGGLAGTTKFGKALGKPVISRALTDGMLSYIAKPQNVARFMEMWGRNATAEIFEEFVESVINTTAEQLIVDGSPDLHEFMRRVGRETADAGPSVAVMTFFGSARGAVTEISDHSGQIEYHQRMLNHMATTIWDNVRNDPERFAEGLDEVNDAIVDTWLDNPREEAINKLEQMGISRSKLTEDVQNSLDVMAELRKETRSILANDGKTIQSQEQSYRRLVEVMKRVGIEPKIVEELSESLDPRNVGQIAGDAIEISEAISDKARVFNHEVWHWGIEQMGLTEKDWEILREATKRPEYREQRIRYSDMVGDARVEDVMADVWANWNPQEKTIFRKVVDFVRKLFGMANETDVFEKLNDYLKTVSKPALTESQAQLQDELEIEEFRKKAEQAKPKFARGQKVDTLESAAANYALARAEGRDAKGLAKRTALRVPSLDEQAIITAGEALYDASLETLSDNADIVEQRIGIRTKAAQRVLRSREKQAMRTGAAIAKAAKVAAEKAVAQEVSRAREIRMAAEKLMPVTIERGNVESVVNATSVGAFTDWYKSIESAAKEYAKSIADESAEVVDALIKHEMFHQMYNIVKHMKYSPIKSGLMTRMHAMRDAAKIDTSKSIAQDVIGRIGRIQGEISKKKAKAEFRELLKSEAGKPLKRRDVVTKRNISEDKHLELRLAGSVAELSIKESDATLDHIEETLDMVSKELSDEKLEERMAVLEGYVPMIATREFDSLSDVAKLNVLHDVLTKYGAVLNRSTEEIQGAIELVLSDVIEGTRTAIEAARELSQKAVDGESLFKKVLRVAPNKIAKAIGGAGTFSYNIRQRLEHFARAGGKEEMAAAKKLLRLLGVQKSDTEEGRIKREMYTDIDGVFKRVYGKNLTAMEYELTDTKDAYKKYNKLNDNALSIDNLIQIVASWEQDDFQPTMKDKMGYTQAMIDEIKQELGPKHLALLTELRSFYQKWGAELDNTSLSVFGVRSSIADKNYMPGQRLGVQTYNAAEIRKTPVAPPSLKERQNSRHSIDVERGALELLQNRIDETSHFISHAEGAVLAQEIFGKRELAKDAINKHGDKLWGDFTRHLQAVYKGGNTFRDSEKALKQLSSALTMRGLSGNVTLLPKQLTSFTAPAFRYGTWGLVKEVFKGGADAVGWLEAYKDIVASDEYKSRIASGATELVEDSLRNEFGTASIDQILSDGNARKAVKVIGKTIRRTYQTWMLPTRIGDIGAILIIGPTVYQASLRENQGDKAAAMEDTWELLQETQQSRALKDRNRLLREGGSVAKILGMFLTTKGQYFAFLSRAMQDLVSQPKDSARWRKAADTVFIHALLDGSFSVVGLLTAWGLFGEEPDEDWQLQVAADVMAGFAGSRPIMGMFAEAGVERLLLGKSSFGGTDFPVQGLKFTAENAADIIRYTRDRDLDKVGDTVIEELENWIGAFRQARKATVKRGE